MNKSQKKKLTIFNLFSQNLEWVKKHPSIKFHPDFSNGCICPLCFDVFFEKDLQTTIKNYLTLEDIPPASLGGKPLALTCKNCNSRSGHELDAHLLKSLVETDSQMFLPNSKMNVTFDLGGNKINGGIQVDNKGTVRLDLYSKHSNPKEAKQFIKEMFPPKTLYNPLFYTEKLFEDEYQSPTFKIKFKQTSNERRAEIALLRIAYLLAYSTLGNGFLINSNLYKVREQILNPDKEVFPRVFWLKYDFPKENEGVNIISLPKELRSFLVIFNLKTKSQTRQFGIVLPGPSTPGIDVYDFITNQLCIGDGTKFTNAMLEHILAGDYLRKKEFAFASSWYWLKFTDKNYQPRLKPETKP